MTLVPSFFVRGTKTTILQGWATRTPVVTTTEAARALGADLRTPSLAIGDDARSVAEELLSTALDASKRVALAREGWKALLAEHSPDRVLADLDRAIHELPATTTRP
jgi:hypothetical protein